MMLRCDTENLKGALHFDHSLKRLNTWRVGGAADCFFKVDDVATLGYFLKYCVADYPVFYLGLGSNVLVRDGGIKGIVISLGSGFNWIEQRGEDIICAGASTSCAKLARFYVNNGLPGLEFMVGIPGTLGGALRMNAGAFGSEIWDYAVAIETIDRQGTRKKRARSEIDVGYRFVDLLDDECIISSEFKRPQKIKAEAELRDQLKTYLEMRNRTQPTNAPTCGSVFKNLQGGSAGKLIEECGLKSYTVGDAMVSEKHANFIVNKGSATANDIEQLIAHIQAVVKERSGVHLQPEVVIVGDHRA